jgi:branched-chain amino acid transport system substrate-binding protein
VMLNAPGPGSPDALEELVRVGYPVRNVISFAWDAAAVHVDRLRDVASADGHFTMQFAATGAHSPVLSEIVVMYEKQGRPVPGEMASTVLYNRGVLVAALHAEAIRHAAKVKGAANIGGADVKTGFEAITRFAPGGLGPPMTVTPADHEGGGLIQVWQVKDGKLERTTEWFTAYRDVVARHVKDAASGR